MYILLEGQYCFSVGHVEFAEAWIKFWMKGKIGGVEWNGSEDGFRHLCRRGECSGNLKSVLDRHRGKLITRKANGGYREHFRATWLS